MAGGVAALLHVARLSAERHRRPAGLAPSQGPAHLRAAAGRRCPGGWRDRLQELLGTRRLQPQLLLLICVALIAGVMAALRAGARAGRPRLPGVRPGVRAGLGCRHRLRRRRGLSGQVSSAGGADPAGRRRPGHLRHLRLVFGARSRPDPAVGRDGDHGAAPARPALAAETHRRCGTGRPVAARDQCAGCAIWRSPWSPGRACRCWPMR